MWRRQWPLLWAEGGCCRWPCSTLPAQSPCPITSLMHHPQNNHLFMWPTVGAANLSENKHSRNNCGTFFPWRPSRQSVNKRKNRKSQRRFHAPYLRRFSAFPAHYSVLLKRYGQYNTVKVDPRSVYQTDFTYVISFQLHSAAEYKGVKVGLLENLIEGSFILKFKSIGAEISQLSNMLLC